ncbi:MAG: FkbM family methyltransferase [Planctomycetaceae bacterium]|jgi:FkbM family methyltransferase|nr:FkbM family methyltransferase [Planctomycetaceae bacterium]
MKLLKKLLKKLVWIFLPKSVRKLYYETMVFWSQRKLAVVLPEGCEYPVFLRRGETDFNLYHEIFVHDLCYEITLPFRPKFMIDCGGNIGLAAIYFKLQYPEIKIVTIEPETSNFELLERNIAPYQSDIIALNMGVWNKTTKLIVKNFIGTAWAFVTEEVTSDNVTNIENSVDAIGINDILSKYANESGGIIDLLKVDIEGSENQLFRTNYEWLSKTRAIVIEFHNRFRPDCSEVFHKAVSKYHFKEISFHGNRNRGGVGFYINEDIVETK